MEEQKLISYGDTAKFEIIEDEIDGGVVEFEVNKEFNEKLIVYLLGKEELFDEVVDELAGRIEEKLSKIDDCDDEEEN